MQAEQYKKDANHNYYDLHGMPFANLAEPTPLGDHVHLLMD